MEGKSIMLLTPAYGGVVYVPYCLSIIKLDRMCRELGIQLLIEMCYNESLIQRARNSNVDSFLRKSDATHALFIDADIEFDPNNIIEMLKADKDVIGGLYPKKSIHWSKIRAFVNSNKDRDLTEEEIEAAGKDYVIIHKSNEPISINNDIIETMYVGTGMMLVKRKVFLEIMEKHPYDIYNGNGHINFMFFNSELKNGVYLSEDYWFCDRWLEMGGKIHMKTFKSNHCGMIKF